MGAYLAQPSKEKSQEEGESDWFRFGECTMQGWRTSQEDAHNSIIDFYDSYSLFAVYDGHGGSEVSKYLSENFPRFMAEKLSNTGDKEIAEELKRIFLEFDATLVKEDVVAILNKLKGEDETAEKEKEQKTTAERMEVEEKKRDSMLKEAITLSKEANVDLSSMIRQYAQYRLYMEARSLKRTAGGDNILTSKRPRLGMRTVTETDGADSGVSSSSDKVLAKVEESETTKSMVDEINNHITEKDVEAVAQSKDQEVEQVEMMDVHEPEVNGKIEGIGATDSDKKLIKGKDEDLAAVEEDAIDRPTSNNNAENLTVEDGNKEVDGAEVVGEQQTDDKKGVVSSTATDSTEQMTFGDQQPHSSRTAARGLGAKGQQTDVDSVSSSDDDPDDEDYTPEGDVSDDDYFDEEEEYDGEDSMLQGLTDEEEEEMDSVLSTENKVGFDSGSTACVALVNKKRVVVGNVGDSRAVLCRGDEALDLSVDHKPEDAREKKRIIRAGGAVSLDGRVNGGLNLSRAFGDHTYKQKTQLPADEQMITAFPDVMEIELTNADKFLVIACDGIWNCMSSQDVVNFVKERVETIPLKEIAGQICDKCCADDTTGDGSGCDNMTVIIVDLMKRVQQPPNELASLAAAADQTAAATA